MENNYRFFKWFNSFISILVDIFFLFIPVVTLFVFTSVFTGLIKYVVFVILVAVYLLFIRLFKDKIKNIINNILDKVDKLSDRQMLLIIAGLMIVLKIIYTIFFNYDATQGGDIKIYNDLAEKIISTGNIHVDAISHLYGLALHFVLFKLLHIPLHIGMFLAFFFGTIINFLSFKDIVGKNKTFLLIVVYLLMPSSILLSFCPTHEIFVYIYLSSFLFLVIRFIKSNNKTLNIIYPLLMVLTCFLTCFVNPAGYIIYVIILLLIALTNIDKFKKIILIFVLFLSILTTRVIDNFLQVNEYITSINTYTILIHGANPESLGEQIDGYPMDQVRHYLWDHELTWTEENMLYSFRQVLINHYIYLITHPVILIKLICNKFYLLWSGNHYSIELAKYYGAFNDYVFYGLLIVSTLIYLFMITVGLVYKKKKESILPLSIYKLALLGVFGVTLLSIVVNKYSVYVTLYMYLILMYHTEFKNE